MTGVKSSYGKVIAWLETKADSEMVFFMLRWLMFVFSDKAGMVFTREGIFVRQCGIFWGIDSKRVGFGLNSKFKKYWKAVCTPRRACKIFNLIRLPIVALHEW